MFAGYPARDRIIDLYERLTYDKFMQLKQVWLKNISLTWLIQGHLTQESALKMVQSTEVALAFSPISTSDIECFRLVKLQNQTVYCYERSN